VPQQERERKQPSSIDTSTLNNRSKAASKKTKHVDNPLRAAHYDYTFRAEYDDEGVWFYQAYNDEISQFAVDKQSFRDCPDFNPSRMTWIKPSFGWVLYRSGYGRKHNQTRVLKIKLPHSAVAHLLSHCKLSTCEDSVVKDAKFKKLWGRVQWDPERDMMSSEGREPRKIERKRAIQIGLAGELSEFYVKSIVEIQDVTELAGKVFLAHQEPESAGAAALRERAAAMPIEGARSGRGTAQNQAEGLASAILVPGGEAIAQLQGGEGAPSPPPSPKLQASGGKRTAEKRASHWARREQLQRETMSALLSELPVERPYAPPGVAVADLERLRLLK